MASAASSAASPETEELKAIHHSPLSGPSDSQQAMTGQLSNLLLAADPDTSDPSEAVLVTSAQERLVKPLRNLAYLNCLALVIGLQIGSGIYSAPAIVSSHVSSAAVGVFIWVLAGALVWTGAASFIELGIALPSNGGIQEYLRHCYGDIYGFLFAWTWIAVVKPCSMAMISLIFSEYLYKAVSPKAEVSVFILKATALLGLASITALNCLGTRTGVDTAKIFMVIKLFGLGSITVIGLAAEAMSIGHEGVRHRSNQTSPETIPPQALPTPLTQLPSIWSTSKDLADAIFAALFSYGGWESISFVTGEITSPSKNLPRVLNHAMAIVISLSVLANVSFYVVLPLEMLRGTNAIALDFKAAILGRAGTLFYAWVVCLSCLGALHATVFSMGRLTQSAGARRYFPAWLKANASLHKGNRHDERRLDGSTHMMTQSHQMTDLAKIQNVPRNAMILNACLSTIYVLIGSFRALLNFKGMTEYLFYFITVLGVLVLRRQSTPASVGYRTSILNPLLFCFVSAMIVARNAISQLTQVVLIAIFFALGATIYRMSWWQRFVGRTEPEFQA